MTNHNGTPTWLAERFELHAQTEPIPAAELSGVDKKLWRGKWLILIGTTAGLLAGMYVCSVSQPEYESKAQVYVRAKRPDALEERSSTKSKVKDDTATHMALLSSPSFIQRAIDTRKLDALKTFANQQDVVSSIIKSLSVSRGQDKITTNPTDILYFKYRGPVAEECGTILSAVIETYDTFLNESNFEEHQYALRIMSDKTNAIRSEIEAKQMELQQLQASSPPSWSAEESTLSVQYHLAELEKRKSDVFLRKTDAQRRVDAIKQATKNGEANRLISLMSATTNLERDKWLEERLFNLLTKKRQLLDEFGEGHPEVQALSEQIQVARQLISVAPENRGGYLNQTDSIGSEHTQQFADAFIATLEQEIRAATAQEEAILGLITHEQKKLKQLAAHEHRAQQLTNDIAQIEFSHQQLLRQTRQVELDRQLVGYSAQIIASPGVGKKVAPIPALVSLVAGFIGANFGLLLAFWKDFSDGRRRKAHAIGATLGLPVFGYVPELRTGRKAKVKTRLNQRTRPDRSLCTIHYPRSPEAESYRSLRTALASIAESRSHNIVQLTGVNEGELSAIIVTNLAVASAQTGKKVLLIDANVRAPQVHRLFDVGVEHGLASAVLDDAELDDIILDTTVDGLSLLPGCAKTPRGADLLALPQFDQILNRAREQFDLVLISTSDLASTSDALVVARNTDGVILSFVKTTDDHHDALCAANQLDAVGANVLGVVVCTPNFRPSRQTIKYPNRIQATTSALARV